MQTACNSSHPQLQHISFKKGKKRAVALPGTKVTLDGDLSCVPTLAGLSINQLHK
jgi:hypothetical protein